MKHFLATAIALCVAASTARAADVFSYSPPQALACVVVRSPAESDAAVAQFADAAGIDLPRPMKLLRAAGLEQVIDPQGELGLILLPGPNSAAAPKPVVMIAVSGYVNFAAATRADPSGEACRIELLGEELLVARKGNYAVLTNPEDEQTMQAVLGQQPTGKTQLDGWALGLADCQAVVLIKPRGISGSRRPRRTRGSQGPFFEQLSGAWDRVLRNSPSLLKDIGRHVDSVAVGVRVDNADALRVKWAFTSNMGFGNGQGTEGPGPDGTLLKSLPDKPLVFAAEGPVAQTGVNWLAALMFLQGERAKLQPEYQALTPEDWETISKTRRLLFDGLQRVCLFVRGTEKDQPLITSIGATGVAADPEAYLAQVEEFFRLTHEIEKKTGGDIQLEYKFEKTPIGGNPGLIIETDIAGASGDENNAVWQLMLQKTLGPEGKLRLLFGTDGKGRVAFATQSEENLLALLRGTAGGEPALTDNPLVRRTGDMLGETKGWKVMFSPSGYITSYKRVLEMLLGWGGVPEFPEFEDTPPLGLTIDRHPTGLHGELVLPSETLRAGVDFFQKTAEKWGDPLKMLGID